MADHGFFRLPSLPTTTRMRGPILKGHEEALRSRESSKMDTDDGWWAYNYPKNLDKQETAKVIVPRLVMSVACSVDPDGLFYLDNVDVGAVSYLTRNSITLVSKPQS